MVSFAGNQITYKGVIENLNVLDFEYYFNLTDAFLTGDSTSVFLLLDDVISKGFDPRHLITGLGTHFRDLLVSKDPKTVGLLETGEGLKNRYLKQAKACSPGFLFKGLKILSETDIDFKTATNQRLHTELGLLRLCRLAEPESSEAEKKNLPKKGVTENPAEQKTSGEDAKPLNEKKTDDPLGDHLLKPEPSPSESSFETQRVRDARSGYTPRTTSI